MKDMYALQQRFSDGNVPSDYLGILLNCRLIVRGITQGSYFLISSQAMLMLLVHGLPLVARL